MIYATACAMTAEDIMDMVNEYIEQGYKPHGSLIFTGCNFVQAMIKE